MRIAVVGAGSWGTAVASLLAGSGHETVLWARSSRIAEAIERERYNPDYLSGLHLPSGLHASSDLAEVVDGAGVVVFATPSHAVRDAATALDGLVGSRTPLVSLAKGIEQGTLMRMSEVIADRLGAPERVAVLSGPNHAEEVSESIPSTTVVSSHDPELAGRLQELFTTHTFRVYTNTDLVGVELAGASKNVIAVACGVSDGLGYGDNTKASLMTRGLAEMTRLGRRAGANPLTYMGLAGMGDLVATCTSPHSRNRALGEWVAQGGTLEGFAERTNMVAEGARTSIAVVDMAGRVGCDTPIAGLVKALLFEGYPVERGVDALMSRDVRDELHGIGLIEDEEVPS